MRITDWSNIHLSDQSFSFFSQGKATLHSPLCFMEITRLLFLTFTSKKNSDGVVGSLDIIFFEQEDRV